MKKILLTLLILTFSTQLLVAQNLKRANSLFERRAYLNAAELYLNEAPKTQEIYEKLGDCYYLNSKMKQAVIYYDILIDNYEKTVSPTYLFRYSQALKGIGNYNKADKYLKIYYETKQLDSSDGLETLTYFETLNKTIKKPYLVHSISSNSAKSDFGTGFYNNSIVFASNRNEGELYDWNNEPYLDLFQAEKTTTGDLVNVKSFSNSVNTKMHESNAVFTKDGKTMYFTRNNFINGKKGRDSKKVSHLKIYKAQFIDNQWTNISELPFNSNDYSVEHPALSPDEKQLYFASDMPGSIGSFDLFVVDILTDGSFGTPKNLGAKINTEHREQFPFVSSNNTIYFASDGHFGLGGLDIFKSEITNEVFSQPINLSNVINSNLDDFAFIIDETAETGYFSSNRTGGKGDDDIYNFTQLKIYYVKGLVQNKNSLELLTDAHVSLLDQNNQIIAALDTNSDASYSFEIEKNTNYTLKATHKLYIPYEVDFATDNEGNINKNIFLLLESYEDAENNIVVENNKTQIKIAPIYFDFDKWNIRKDAALELDNIVNTMKKYKDMVIEIGAHTDCRGSDDYNLKLSDLRAKSVCEYLMSQGVLETQINCIGLGETQPLNKCINDVHCTEKEHALNRRCEFVLKN